MADRLTPPYQRIRNELRAGRVIPFLGAGASFGSRNPSKTAWKPAAGADNDLSTIAYLPTASELADHLATEASFPDGESRELAKVSQYYQAIIGAKSLKDTLRDIFTYSQQPGPLHTYLADVARQAALLIVTTNYDDLIERAFDAVSVPYDIVIHMTDSAGGDVLWRPHGKAASAILAKDLDLDLNSVTVIYKIHGSIDRSASPSSHYVITEDDYIDFLTRMTKGAAIPNIFADPFQSRPFLFLGYGLYDWNLRVVLNHIHRELRRPSDITSWAIETMPKALEKELWSKRGVAVFDGLTLDDFVEKLRTAGAPPPKP
jgi:hypothetical protein